MGIILKEIFLFADRIYFGWPAKVSEGRKPRDKTLRKLYMFTDHNPQDIDLFIGLLKKVNHTTVWLAEKPEKKYNIQDWINSKS